MCASPLSLRHAQPDWMGGGLVSRQMMHAPPSAAIFPFQVSGGRSPVQNDFRTASSQEVGKCMYSTSTVREMELFECLANDRLASTELYDVLYEEQEDTVPPDVFPYRIVQPGGRARFAGDWTVDSREAA